ncbi:hypothetical protein GCM10023310_02600 [Paenibacillus vulneris]
MSLTILFLLGIIGVTLVMTFRAALARAILDDNAVVQRLRGAAWFHHYWKGGLLLFAVNAALFFTAVLGFYGAIMYSIPYVHILLMLIAVVGSIYVWLIINRSWRGLRRDRIKMGLVGSSFYALLGMMFMYGLMTLKPSYPGEDTFMGAIGLLFAIVAALGAFVTCLVLTGFSKSDQK